MFAVWHGLAMLHGILMFVIMHVRNICFEILNILRNINSLCKSTEKHSQILVNVYEIRNNHERRICIEISAINHFMQIFSISKNACLISNFSKNCTILY